MSFSLRRVSDGEGYVGASSEAIEWNEDNTFKSVVNHIPVVGCSMKVGSLIAGTYSKRDWWLTTIVTEILEEIKNDDVHYVRFKTENSEYEWWNGKYPKSVMTKKEVLSCNPEFKFGNMTMVDWFEITEGGSFCTIRSGLSHADGETKSPYHYEDIVIGDNALEKALDKFTIWWDSLNKNNNN
jgi:hypothetical protein